MDIQSCKISTTKDKLTSRSGLAALAELIRKLGLDAHFERPLMELLGCEQLPGDDALSRWLRCHGARCTP